MTYKPPNTWKALCGRSSGSHRNVLNRKTTCTQSKTFKTPEQEELAQVLLKHWLNECPKYATCLDHMKFRPCSSTCPSAAEVERKKLPDDYNSDDDALAVRSSVGGTAKRPKFAHASTKTAVISSSSPAEESSSSSSSSSSDSASS